MKKIYIISIICVILITGIALFFLFTLNSKYSASTALPDYSIRVTPDSVYIDGAVRYSNTFVLQRYDEQFKYEDKNNNDKSIRQERLNNPRRVILQFTQPINGYNVHVTLHPDDDFEWTGMAEWVFEKGSNQIRVDNGFDWEWKEDIQRPTNGEIPCNGELYEIVPKDEMVQGRDTVIYDTPFCFKDVDFDDEFELCFKAPGWNRYYFNAYKIVSPTRAEMMTGHPYNNLVYSDVESCNTVFDFQKETINMTEVAGSQFADHLYGRREKVTDVLNPLQHISGTEASLGGGFNEYDTFENGQWVKSEREFNLDDSDYEIKADYEHLKDRTIELKRLWYRNWLDDEGWKLLCTIKSKVFYCKD